MAKRIKLKRLVTEYKRKTPDNKTIKVKPYLQSYNSPRGQIRSLDVDPLNHRSQTMWLMDRHGHFVGRANYRGKTAARNVIRYGYDNTTVIRDAQKYKRVFGRMKSS